MTNLNTFDEVQDNRIRNRNRAVTLANLFEDHMEPNKRVTSQKGAALILAYFAKLPDDDKKTVYEDYKKVMLERGFKISEGL